MNCKSLFNIFNIKKYIFKNKEHKDIWNNNIKYNKKKLFKYIKKTLNGYDINKIKTKSNGSFIYLNNNNEEKCISFNNFYNLIKNFKSNIKLYEFYFNDNCYLKIIFDINNDQYHSKYNLINKYCFVSMSKKYTHCNIHIRLYNNN